MRIEYGERICEVVIAKAFESKGGEPYDLAEDTVRYAIDRMFQNCSKELASSLTYECWQLRLDKATSKKVSCVVPAKAADLPGGWCKISGKLSAVGFTITGAELSEKPFPVKKPVSREKKTAKKRNKNQRRSNNKNTRKRTSVRVLFS